MSYVEDRLAEIRASQPESELQTKLPKQSKAQAIRARLRAQRKPVVAAVGEPEQEAAARLDLFVGLAAQLRQEDVELIEK